MFAVVGAAACVAGMEELCCAPPKRFDVFGAAAPEVAAWLNNPPVEEACVAGVEDLCCPPPKIFDVFDAPALEVVG